MISTGYSGQFTVNVKENILVKYGMNVETWFGCYFIVNWGGYIYL